MATNQDEIGHTGQALDDLLAKLQDSLGAIAERVTKVSAAANQMATTSGQVATASHQQSEAASAMAATVEELTVSINHVGERAQDADRTISSQATWLVPARRSSAVRLPTSIP